MIFRHKAIRILYPEVVTSVDNKSYNSSGALVNVDEDAVAEKMAELQADYDAKQYQRDRADAYPDLKEQLDLLWHAIDGGKFNVKSKETDFYKKLKAVKDANPKPE